MTASTSGAASTASASRSAWLPVPAGHACSSRNFAGERPVVKGQLWLISPRYWTIRGINVTRSGRTRNNLARVSGGTHWVWENSEIWNSRAQAGLLIDDGADDDRPIGRFTVRRNCIHDTVPNAGPNQDHNIYVSDFNGSPGADGLIERNIMRNATNGRGIKFGPGDDVGGPITCSPASTRSSTRPRTSASRPDPHDITPGAKSPDPGQGGEHLVLGAAREEQRGARQRRGRAAGLLRSGGPSARPVADGGGNRRLTTGFDSVSCSGFHPANPEARKYGRYAPTVADLP